MVSKVCAGVSHLQVAESLRPVWLKFEFTVLSQKIHFHCILSLSKSNELVIFHINIPNWASAEKCLGLKVLTLILYIDHLLKCHRIYLWNTKSHLSLSIPHGMPFFFSKMKLFVACLFLHETEL